MTKTKLTKREKYIAVPGYVLLSCRRKACSENSKADTETHEENLNTDLRFRASGELLKRHGKRLNKLESENLSASVGFLVLLIVFLLGNLLGHWVSNFLRESTWHSPKGCPLFVRQEK